METSLHRQLKALYAHGDARLHRIGDKALVDQLQRGHMRGGGKGGQPAMRRPACAEIVLRVHLEPAGRAGRGRNAGRYLLKRKGVMLRLEANACP